MKITNTTFVKVAASTAVVVGLGLTLTGCGGKGDVYQYAGGEPAWIVIDGDAVTMVEADEDGVQRAITDIEAGELNSNSDVYDVENGTLNEAKDTVLWEDNSAPIEIADGLVRVGNEAVFTDYDSDWAKADREKAFAGGN